MKSASQLLVGFLILIISSNGFATDPCNCKDRKAPNHYRYHEKRETDFGKYAVVQNPITSNDVIDWQKTYRDVTKSLKSRSKEAPRAEGTPEDSLYTLKGYMWYVKHESSGTDPDCDFHIEIGPKGKAGKRVVVEVTMDKCGLQQEILDTLSARGYKLRKEFTHGIPCTVIGLGFYDGVHPPAGHGRKNKTTFSSWELHPVKSIIFEQH